MADLSRRTFLMSTGLGLAATSAAYRSAAAPNDRIRHAVIGTGGQGTHHVENFSAEPDCQVVAVCDVDPERRAKAAAKAGHPEVAQYEDFRKLLDEVECDTVSIATPDHWHTPVALWALAAGKHVYVEKPCSHNIGEGRILVKAATETGKCVQHGTQIRSAADRREAIRFLHEGGIGTVRAAKAINHQLREPIGRAKEEAPPAGVNYDLWLGPAPARPFTHNRWHYQWHWFWDYGTGDTGNDGVHQIDIARWGLNAGLPDRVTAAGAQLFYDDDHETPDTQTVTFDYGDRWLLFEMRLWTDYPLEGHDNGNIFYGDKGTLEIGRKGCFVRLIGEEPRKIEGEGGNHVRNFLDAVKANDPNKLNARIDEGARSAELCHLANIGTRLGRVLRCDTRTGEIEGDDEAKKMTTRVYREGYELPTV